MRSRARTLPGPLCSFHRRRDRLRRDGRRGPAACGSSSSGSGGSLGRAVPARPLTLPSPSRIARGGARRDRPRRGRGGRRRRGRARSSGAGGPESRSLVRHGPAGGGWRPDGAAGRRGGQRRRAGVLRERVPRRTRAARVVPAPRHRRHDRACQRAVDGARCCRTGGRPARHRGDRHPGERRRSRSPATTVAGSTEPEAPPPPTRARSSRMAREVCEHDTCGQTGRAPRASRRSAPQAPASRGHRGRRSREHRLHAADRSWRRSRARPRRRWRSSSWTPSDPRPLARQRRQRGRLPGAGLPVHRRRRGHGRPARRRRRGALRVERHPDHRSRHDRAATRARARGAAVRVLEGPTAQARPTPSRPAAPTNPALRLARRPSSASPTTSTCHDRDVALRLHQRRGRRAMVVGGRPGR